MYVDMAPTQVVCDPIILCHLVQISSAFKKFGIKDASENVLVVVLHSSRDGHEVSKAINEQDLSNLCQMYMYMTMFRPDGGLWPVLGPVKYA